MIRRDIRVVSPYRPFAPESIEHERLGPFDWVQALRLLAASVAHSCDCETLALTDTATDLPVPALRYATTEPRLMRWILDVTLRYLESEAFDRDTALVSPDILVFRDLRPFFAGDLAILVRLGDHVAGREILNGVQFFAHKGKKRLVKFYREALALAQTLPEKQQRWGGDTEPLQELLAPMTHGCAERRRGMKVAMWPASSVLWSVSSPILELMAKGQPVPWPTSPVVDFKYLRKKFLFAYFNATLGRHGLGAA
jgi:hypothetical protein